MKKYFSNWLAFSALALLAISCAGPNSRTALPRFREDANTDLVLRFYRWDTIYLTKPDSREGGFLPVYSRDDIARELSRRQMGRNLAVVVVGLSYVIENDSSVVRDWKTLLAGQGFRRVVFLRSSGGKEINGLPILHDSTIAGVDDTSVPARSSLAEIPSASATDAADSPGSSGR